MRVDEGEECDQATNDCANCVVQAQDISRGGDFNGSFQSKSFDRYIFTTNKENAVELKASSAQGDCPADLVMEVYVRNGNMRGDLVTRSDNEGFGLCPKIGHFPVAHLKSSCVKWMEMPLLGID